MFNQFTESFSVLGSRSLVQLRCMRATYGSSTPTTRVEMDAHYYHAPTTDSDRSRIHPLSAAPVESAFEIRGGTRNWNRSRVILPLSRWKPDLAAQEPPPPEAAVPSGAVVVG